MGLARSRGPKHPLHRIVVDLRRRHTAAGGLLVTTDYVLDEMMTRLFSRRPFREAQTFSTAVLNAGKAGILAIESVDRDRFKEAYKMRLRYRDKPSISFTDFTSLVVMKERDAARVVTGDEHFVQIGLGFEKLP